VTLVALAATCGGGFWVHSRKALDDDRFLELYHGNSNFGQLRVIQIKRTGERYYLNDFLTQDTYDTNSQQSLSMFTFMLHDLARAYTTNVSTVLCIGLGVGIVPMQFAREGDRVDVVEINPAVVPVAREFFDLQPEKLQLTIGDGRQFVNECTNRYDAIILDAFLGESSPSHLMSREAFTAMRRILRPAGVLVINCFGDFDPGEDFLVASLQKTLTNVFASVRVHSDSTAANTFFVASPAPLVLHHAPAYDHINNPACRDRVQAAFAGIIAADTDHGIVLTDNYNPVDYYDAANRERVRRNLALSMRGL